MSDEADRSHPGHAGRRTGGEAVEPDAVGPTGRFRIYLGAAAGVGKTFAMLDEGWRRHRRGADVVVGFVETHGRPRTAELIRDLEVVPRRVVSYRGTQFEEMDVDAVLARTPALALVDELAHTNVPGSGRNDKRWQDVIELLDAGIAVITTVNVQHLESIADAVERMTATRVRERVPDWVVRRADQLELIDSSPEALRRRMVHGNIYPAEKVPEALTHFFRTENLVALRELALRFVADQTEDELLAYLHERHPDAVWETRERIMVAVTGAHGTDAVIRRAARIAARTKADLHAVHIVAAEQSRRGGPALEALHQLVDDLGAEWHELNRDDPARALVDFARENQVTQIVMGSSRRSRWEELTKGSVVQRVLRFAADCDVDVHVIARRDVDLAEVPEPAE
ncbi:MAG TPA: universal stress protein [Acidimicrobiales bacterium]|nr:universal stress protein [Acidimicrobiales bacterium]